MSHFGPTVERNNKCGITIENDKPTVKDFTTQKMLITPTTAKEMLLHNTKNRSLDPKRVDFFVKLLKDSLFQCTPHGIIFDNDGVLVDGQARLSAISKSGIQHEMFVARGVSPDCRLAIDANATRTPAATSRIMGRENDTSRHYAIVKDMKLGPEKASHTRIDVSHLQMWVDEFEPSLNFVLSCSKKGVPSMIQSVCARAWYTRTKERAKIARFIEVYSKGITNGESESSVVKLKNMVLAKRFVGKTYVAGNGTTVPARRAFHQFTENALENFLNGVPVKTPTRATEEKFPLPSELNGWNGDK